MKARLIDVTFYAAQVIVLVYSLKLLAGWLG